jgi:hypothetical protein
MSNKETEIVIYSKINNLEGLNECNSSEQHNEGHNNISDTLRLRVRKTTPIDSSDNKQELTFKLKKPINKAIDPELVSSNIEYNNDIELDQFNDLLDSCEYLVNKKRYVFNCENVSFKITIEGEEKEITIPDLIYEVDVFTDKNSQIIEWCKIEVEIDPIFKFLDDNYPNLIDQITFKVKISHLPFKPIEAIITNFSDEKTSAFIDNLWEHQYKIKTDINNVLDK